jgi:N4-gp56 family major capsid protein
MAGEFTWTYDSPTGTYKSPYMSRRLYKAATHDTIFFDYARPVGGYGSKSGEQVTFTRVATLPEPIDATLPERELMPEDTFTLSTATIPVKEMGRAVPYTSLADELSTYSLESPIQEALRDQMHAVLDTSAANAMKVTPVKYTPTGTTATPTSLISTTGTPGAQASRNFMAYDAGEIRDYMYDTLLTPGWTSDEYIGIFRSLALRGIKNDPNWEVWHQYADPDAKYNSEIGKFEGIRFIETNHARALGKVGPGGILGEGVVFGKEAIAMAEAMTPELRAKIPEDYGRKKGIAWYGIVGFGSVWGSANAGECRVVHVTSLP